MSNVISKILKIATQNMPPKVDFIEQQIKLNKIEPIRWAIVDIEGNNLTISVSGRKLD